MNEAEIIRTPRGLSVRDYLEDYEYDEDGECYCDRCGAQEMGPRIVFVKILSPNMTKTVELCSRCILALEKFLNNLPVETDE